MKQRVMVFVLVAGTMIACSKGDKNKVQVVNEAQSKTALVADDPTKRARVNPYDSSGIRHNELLEFIRNYQKETGDTTRAGRKNFFLQMLMQQYGRTPKIDLDKIDAMFLQIQQMGLVDFLSKSPLTDRVKNYFLRLDEITKKVKNPDFFPMFLSDITKLEQDILKANLSQHDTESILSITSITWHSGLYWEKVYDDNTWTNPSAEPASLRWWQFPIVMNADFLGGLLGYLTGCCDRGYIEDAAGWMSGGAEGFLGS